VLAASQELLPPSLDGISTGDRLYEAAWVYAKLSLWKAGRTS